MSHLEWQKVEKQTVIQISPWIQEFLLLRDLSGKRS